MTAPFDQAGTSHRRIVISIDAMGGDRGPSVVVAGMAESASKNPDLHFIVHGPKAELEPLIARQPFATRCEIRDARGVVHMDDKPSHVMRNGQDTSMWSAIEAVRDGRADVVISCGNTGALMALSMLRLRKAEGVDRPAIACLWPSRNPSGFNVMLDAGADIRADEGDLLTYALMGASYARNAMNLKRPRIGLLNVGVEEHKGRAELKVAHELIGRAAERGDYEYIGFVEGGDMPSDRVDVIVTDGFTGNIALKTGEGTSTLISTVLREEYGRSIFSKFAALLALGTLSRLRRRIDPRRVNGGVFLGLNKTVIKSHGSADATGVAAALKLAHSLGSNRFSDKLAARVASAAALAQDALTGAEKTSDVAEDERKS